VDGGLVARFWQQRAEVFVSSLNDLREDTLRTKSAHRECRIYLGVDVLAIVARIAKFQKALAADEDY
jgi:hypothetical protein